MIRPAFVLLMAAQLFGGGERNTREGAEHFAAGRLEEALRAFSQAEGAHPDAPENDLNIAGVHYRFGEAERAPAAGEDGPLAEALRGYQAALEGGAGGALRRDAYYNLANTLFRAGAFPEAAAAYGEAIALDPEDLEARQNLERALRAADEQEQQGQDQQGQQQPEQDQEEPGQEGQDQEEPGQEGQGQEGQGQDGQGQDGQGQDGQEPQGPQEPHRERQQEPESEEEEEERTPPEGEPQSPDRPPADDAGPGAETPDSAPGEVPEISPEQAERILAALADVERAFQEDRLERRRARALRRGRH